MEKAASAVYPDTKVQEWFEYGGEPYHFRLDVGLPEGVWDPESKRRLMWGLYYYKNLRSHLDAVEFHLPPAVLENRQAFLLYSLLILSHGAKLEDRTAFQRMLFQMRKANRYCVSAGWLIQNSQRLENRTQFSQFTVSLHGANNQGVEEILLNGRRLLDGSWVLGQGRSRGAGVPAVHLRLAAGVPPKHLCPVLFQGFGSGPHPAKCPGMLPGNGNGTGPHRPDRGYFEVWD